MTIDVNLQPIADGCRELGTALMIAVGTWSLAYLVAQLFKWR